jgi:uncharacterized Zn finger protein (UPF0148 family)
MGKANKRERSDFLSVPVGEPEMADRCPACGSLLWLTVFDARPYCIHCGWRMLTAEERAADHAELVENIFQRVHAARIRDGLD